ncbi:hypothetical protein BpHYR1_011281 [Brachionus plicatilis]|uniref:Uncharacterized protein n=1 Tax=Brachionus plicatilis TaxID=10195 RepID=A0A3M7QTM7_BRAPC|nr:hypothetical protein BpHYR1_011281 [Brachionus plicatilis]
MPTANNHQRRTITHYQQLSSNNYQQLTSNNNTTNFQPLPTTVNRQRPTTINGQRPYLLINIHTIHFQSQIRKLIFAGFTEMHQLSFIYIKKHILF